MKTIMKKRIFHMCIAAICVFGLIGFTGCDQQTGLQADPKPVEQQIASQDGGTLFLKVDPEIAIEYDKDGNVTSLKSRNDAGKEILQDYTGYEGKPCRTVVDELINKIGAAGYFVDDVENGYGRQIVLEIEKGSQLPTTTFMDDIVADVRSNVTRHHWKSPVDVRGESDYGITDYVDTDYGPNNDGDTDYRITDYGSNNDGVTDYHDTDYGPDNDGVTDYNHTDYGPDNDGVTDYHHTDYHHTDYNKR